MQYYYIAKEHFVSTVSRLHHLKLECSVKRSPVIGSYNIQGGQSQRACVASASKILSEYTASVASTKNDNALTWTAIQFEMKNSCNILRVYISYVFLSIALNWTEPVHFIYWGDIHSTFMTRFLQNDFLLRLVQLVYSNVWRSEFI